MAGTHLKENCLSQPSLVAARWERGPSISKAVSISRESRNPNFVVNSPDF